MGGLGGERERWELQSQKFEQRIRFVLGDMIISAGMVSNLGVFTSGFRARLLKTW
jgi:dynein heavy chain